MKEKEEDDDGSDGPVERPPLILSKVEEPEEQRNSNCDERKQQINQEVDIDVLRSLIRYTKQKTYQCPGNNRGR